MTDVIFSRDNDVAGQPQKKSVFHDAGAFIQSGGNREQGEQQPLDQVDARYRRYLRPDLHQMGWRTVSRVFCLDGCLVNTIVCERFGAGRADPFPGGLRHATHPTERPSRRRKDNACLV